MQVQGGPDNLLSGWPKATGGRLLIREYSGGLLCARDAALAHPDNTGTPGVVRATLQMPRSLLRGSLLRFITRIGKPYPNPIRLIRFYFFAPAF